MFSNNNGRSSLFHKTASSKQKHQRSHSSNNNLSEPLLTQKIIQSDGTYLNSSENNLPYQPPNSTFISTAEALSIFDDAEDNKANETSTVSNHVNIPRQEEDQDDSSGDDSLDENVLDKNVIDIDTNLILPSQEEAMFASRLFRAGYDTVARSTWFEYMLLYSLFFLFASANSSTARNWAYNALYGLNLLAGQEEEQAKEVNTGFLWTIFPIALTIQFLFIFISNKNMGIKAKRSALYYYDYWNDGAREEFARNRTKLFCRIGSVFPSTFATVLMGLNAFSDSHDGYQHGDYVPNWLKALVAFRMASAFGTNTYFGTINSKLPPKDKPLIKYLLALQAKLKDLIKSEGDLLMFILSRSELTQLIDDYDVNNKQNHLAELQLIYERIFELIPTLKFNPEAAPTTHPLYKKITTPFSAVFAAYATTINFNASLGVPVLFGLPKLKGIIEFGQALTMTGGKGIDGLGSAILGGLVGGSSAIYYNFWINFSSMQNVFEKYSALYDDWRTESNNSRSRIALVPLASFFYGFVQGGASFIYAYLNYMAVRYTNIPVVAAVFTAIGIRSIDKTWEELMDCYYYLVCNRHALKEADIYAYYLQHLRNVSPAMINSYLASEEKNIPYSSPSKNSSGLITAKVVSDSDNDNAYEPTHTNDLLVNPDNIVNHANANEEKQIPLIAPQNDTYSEDSSVEYKNPDNNLGKRINLVTLYGNKVVNFIDAQIAALNACTDNEMLEVEKYLLTPSMHYQLANFMNIIPATEQSQANITAPPISANSNITYTQVPEAKRRNSHQATNIMDTNSRTVPSMNSSPFKEFNQENFQRAAEREGINILQPSSRSPGTLTRTIPNPHHSNPHHLLNNRKNSRATSTTNSPSILARTGSGTEMSPLNRHVSSSMTLT